MGSISDYLENELLDHVLKVGAYTVPTNIYVALSTTDPLDTGAGISEPVGGSYARVQCNNWSTAANRSSANSTAVNFPTATGSWGTLTHFALFDAISGGNMLAHGALGTPRTISSGQSIGFAIGTIIVSFLSGAISNYLANELLDHVLKVGAYTVPTNIYAALADATITDATDGTSISEPSDGSYARVNHNSWDAAASGASENTGAIEFPTVANGWGTLTHAALLDALTGGNLLIYLALDSAVDGNNGDDISFADGALDITIS